MRSHKHQDTLKSSFRTVLLEIFFLDVDLVKVVVQVIQVSRGFHNASSSGRSFGEGDGYTLQYSCLENPTDRGAWRATVHAVAKGTRLSG